jgi:hypothetical protein
MLQANEMLLSAKSIKNPEEREAKLREALQVCKQFVFDIFKWLLYFM